MFECNVKELLDDIAEGNPRVKKNLDLLKKNFDAIKNPEMKAIIGYIHFVAITNLIKAIHEYGLTVRETKVLLKTIEHAIIADIEFQYDARVDEAHENCRKCTHRGDEGCAIAEVRKLTNACNGDCDDCEKCEDEQPKGKVVEFKAKTTDKVIN